VSHVTYAIRRKRYKGHSNVAADKRKREEGIYMNADHSNTIVAAVIAVGLILAAAEFDLVRELLAALVIFAVLFSAVGTALLIMVAIEESILTGITHLEPRPVRVRVQDREI
jgi:hypothetical protein